MREASEEMQTRIRQARHNGGLVGSYPAILVITQEPQPGRTHPILMDAKPARGYFLSAGSDLTFALDGCPIHTDDVGEIRALPSTRGVWYVTVELLFNFAEEWDFRIKEAALAMNLDLVEPAELWRQAGKASEPLGFNENDLRALSGMILDWRRINSIMHPGDEIAQQQAARYLKTIERLLPPECVMCGGKLITGKEIESGYHQECISALGRRIDGEITKLHEERQGEGQEMETCPSCGSQEVRGATCLDCGHVGEMAHPLTTILEGKGWEPLLQVQGWKPGMAPPSWVLVICGCKRPYQFLGVRDDDGALIGLGICSLCGEQLEEVKEDRRESIMTTCPCGRRHSIMVSGRDLQTGTPLGMGNCPTCGGAMVELKGTGRASGG